jgi:hypothetical protein
MYSSRSVRRAVDFVKRFLLAQGHSEPVIKRNMGSHFLNGQEASLHENHALSACYAFRSHPGKRGAGMSVESITQQVKAEIAKLNQVLLLLEDGPKQTTVTTHMGAPRRKLSASARRRISAAQKARWAKVRAAKK